MLSYSRVTRRGRVLPKLMVPGVMIAGTTKLADASCFGTGTIRVPASAPQGTFTTVDTPDSAGFYLITGITGVRNGQTISGLQPVGTPIPGNEPFDVDNLVRTGTTQLRRTDSASRFWVG